MKITNISIIFFLIISCKTNNSNMSDSPDKGIFLAGNSYVYNNGYYFKCDKSSDLINQDLIINKEFIEGDNPSSYYNYHGIREGTLLKGKQNGLWQSKRFFYYDSLGYSKSKRYIFREEYFKKGLRDSIYKIYNKEGKVIYSTYFKNGNGIEKDFHENGKLYYEIETKDGYFTDTLKLYNDKGKIIGKRLYIKDSLVYSEGLPCFPYRPSSVPSD